MYYVAKTFCKNKYLLDIINFKNKLFIIKMITDLFSIIWQLTGKSWSVIWKNIELHS